MSLITVGPATSFEDVSVKIYPYFIGVAGGTAGGKTTFARRFVERADPGEAAIIYLDSYYNAQDHIDLEQRKKVNYDHPAAFEFNLLLQHLKALKAGGSVSMPRYDFERHTRSQTADEFKASPIILIEGILVLYHEGIRSFLDMSVFVDAPEYIRLDRRITRDIQERGRTRESVVTQWNNTVQPMHYEYCLPTKARADYVISGIVANDTFIDDQLQCIRSKNHPQ